MMYMNAAMPEPNMENEGVFGAAPELHAVAPDIDSNFKSAVDYIVGDELGPYTTRKRERELNSPSFEVFWMGEVEKTGFKFVSLAASSVVEGFDDGSEEERTKELVDGVIRSAIGEENALHVELYILSAAEKIHNLRKFVSNIITRPEETAQSSEEKFGLMKLLASKCENPRVNDTDARLCTLQVLYAFDHIESKYIGSSYKVAEDLEEGQFDKQIAEEVLVEATQENSELPKNDVVELTKLIKFAESLSGVQNRDELMDIITSPSALENWPDACARILNSRKSTYLHQLRQNYSDSLNYLNIHGTLALDASEQAITQAAEDMAMAMARQMSTNTLLPPRERIRAQAVIMSRRRLRKLGGLASTTEEPSQEQEQPQSRPREVVFLNPNGTETLESQGEFGAMIDKYVSGHKGEVGLKADIENMLEHLKSVDMSAGLPRGIQKLNKGRGAIRIYDRMVNKIYRLSPSDAINLPTSTAIAEKVRIVFVMEKGKIGIVDIVDKDDFQNFQNKHGLGRSKHK